MEIVRKRKSNRLCHAAIHDGIVYLTGQVGRPEVGVEEQTRDVLAAIEELLAESGSDKSRILHAQVWLADITDFPALNAAWDSWVDRDDPPTRSTCQAIMTSPDYRVEITVTAALVPPQHAL